MANSVTHLPHIVNTQAGVNKWDPMYQAIFEVYFDLPAPIKSEFAEEEAILTEQVISVGGLDALQKTVQAGSQKFMGVDVSYLNPTLDNTYCEFTMQLNLNLRNANDAYVLKVFKAWSKLGYDLTDGTRTLMDYYTSDSVRIAEAGRDGTIWRSFIFRKVMLVGLTGLDELNYTNNDARVLTANFRADWWEEELS